MTHTGTGEHIIRTNLARRLGEALRVAAAQSGEGEDPHDILNRILADDFGGNELDFIHQCQTLMSFK